MRPTLSLPMFVSVLLQRVTVSMVFGLSVWQQFTADAAEPSILSAETIGTWLPNDPFTTGAYAGYCAHPPVQRQTVATALSEEEKLLLRRAKLVGLQVVFRHGARIPTSPLKKCFNVPNYSMIWNCGIQRAFQEVGADVRDPKLKLEAVYPSFTGRCGTGRLQDEAEGQFTHLAETLKKSYDFEALGVSKQNVWLRADEVARTQASMFILVNHLFPNAGLLNLHVMPFSIDAWSGHPDCPQMLNAIDDIANTADFPSIPGDPENAKDPTSNRMATLWAKATGTFFRPISSKDCLTQAACTPLQLPRGFTKELFQWAMKKSLHAQQVKYLSRPEVSKVLAAPALFDLQDLFQAQVAKHHKKSTPPLALYSTHDTTMIRLLVSLGLWDGQWPTYAETMIVEAYQTNTRYGKGEAYFRLLRRGRPLAIPACGGKTICPAKIFSELGMPSLRDPAQMALYCKGESALENPSSVVSLMKTKLAANFKFAARTSERMNNGDRTDWLHWMIGSTFLAIVSAIVGFVAARRCATVAADRCSCYGELAP